MSDKNHLQNRPSSPGKNTPVIQRNNDKPQYQYKSPYNQPPNNIINKPITPNSGNKPSSSREQQRQVISNNYNIAHSPNILNKPIQINNPGQIVRSDNKNQNPVSKPNNYHYNYVNPGQNNQPPNQNRFLQAVKPEIKVQPGGPKISNVKK